MLSFCDKAFVWNRCRHKKKNKTDFFSVFRRVWMPIYIDVAFRNQNSISISTYISIRSELLFQNEKMCSTFDSFKLHFFFLICSKFHTQICRNYTQRPLAAYLQTIWKWLCEPKIMYVVQYILSWFSLYLHLSILNVYHVPIECESTITS